MISVLLLLALSVNNDDGVQCGDVWNELIRVELRYQISKELKLDARLHTFHFISYLLQDTNNKTNKTKIIITSEHMHRRRYTSIYILLFIPTAVFSLLFRDFSLFRDNSVLELHQFCVVLENIFIASSPKKKIIKKY